MCTCFTAKVVKEPKKNPTSTTLKCNHLSLGVGDALLSSASKILLWRHPTPSLEGWAYPVKLGCLTQLLLGVTFSTRMVKSFFGWHIWGIYGVIYASIIFSTHMQVALCKLCIMSCTKAQPLSENPRSKPLLLHAAQRKFQVIKQDQPPWRRQRVLF